MRRFFWTPKTYIQKTFSPQQTGWFQVAQVFDVAIPWAPAAWPGRKLFAFRIAIRGDAQLRRATAENNFRGVWMYLTKSLGGLADVWYSMTKTCFFSIYSLLCLLDVRQIPLGFPHIKIMTAVALLIYVQKCRWILRLGRLIFVNFVTSSRTRECYIWYIYIYIWYIYIYHIPDTQCMVCLPTFTMKIKQM